MIFWVFAIICAAVLAVVVISLKLPSIDSHCKTPNELYHFWVQIFAKRAGDKETLDRYEGTPYKRLVSLEKSEIEVEKKSPLSKMTPSEKEEYKENDYKACLMEVSKLIYKAAEAESTTEPGFVDARKFANRILNGSFTIEDGRLASHRFEDDPEEEGRLWRKIVIEIGGRWMQRFGEPGAFKVAYSRYGPLEMSPFANPPLQISIEEISPSSFPNIKPFIKPDISPLEVKKIKVVEILEPEFAELN